MEPDGDAYKSCNLKLDLNKTTPCCLIHLLLK